MNILELVQTASKESPVYVKANLYEEPLRFRKSSDRPYAVDVILAVVSATEDYFDICIHTAVVDPGTPVYEPFYCHQIRFGDYYNLEQDQADIEVIPSSEELNTAYARFLELHRSAPFFVTARLYQETATYPAWDKDHLYPHYAAVEGTEHTWSLEGEKLMNGQLVNSLETAQIWMVENHPEYLQGMCIRQEIPSGDFSCSSVPGKEYPEGMYETFEGRMKYAQDLARRLGTQIRK